MSFIRLIRAAIAVLNLRFSISSPTFLIVLWILVENSVLFHSVTVEEGASVQYSILMPGAVVKAGAQVTYAIVAENAVVEARASIGTAPNDDPNWGIAVVASGVTVGEGAVVSPSAMVREDVKGGERV